MTAAAIPEKPINLSAHDVQAVLTGRKTQLRIPVTPTKNVKDFHSADVANCQLIGKPWESDRYIQTTFSWLEKDSSFSSRQAYIPFPFVRTGACLWARETFLLRRSGTVVAYKADMDEIEAAGFGAMYGGWRPSTQMPRSLARLTLEITAVRVQRLQKATIEDAVAEGIQYPVTPVQGQPGKVHPMICISDPHLTRHLGKRPWTHENLIRAHFAAAWDAAWFKKGFGWEMNPWVWVVELRKVAA